MITQLADYRILTALSLAAIAATVTFVPARSQKATGGVQHAYGLAHFARPLNRTARRLATGINHRRHHRFLSTAGAGASSKLASYPSRLEADLNGGFLEPHRHQYGVNGTEVNDMIAKFEQDVVAEKPDL
jgi:hypothetical protein